jgi:hypothetical protein
MTVIQGEPSGNGSDDLLAGTGNALSDKRKASVEF